MSDDTANIILERLDRVLRRVEAIRSELLADFAQVKGRVNAVEKAVVSFEHALARHNEAAAMQWQAHDDAAHNLNALRGDFQDLAARIDRLETIGKPA